MVGAESRIKTKRWNDPAASDDGRRLLVCRYRPRGVRKEDETWDAWLPQLGPSRELHADYYGKRGPPIDSKGESAGVLCARRPIGWPDYRRRFLAEMAAQEDAVAALAAQVAGGERITLLCSSACTNPDRCHRTLLKALLEEKLATARHPRR